MADGIEVLHVGSACRDVDPVDGRGWRLGGGVTYAALTTARLGLRTAAIVGVDPAARAAAELDALRDAGVALHLVDLDEGPVYRNVETPAGRSQTCLQTGVPLPIPAIPPAWLEAPAWSIVPVAGEVRDDWATVIPDDAFVALAWQGLLRDLVAGRRVRPRPPAASDLVRRADLVGVSHRDLDGRTAVRELTALLHPGARLLVTRGSDGGLLLTAGGDQAAGSVDYLAAATAGEVDPTGAGDTFLAALVASRIRPDVSGSAATRAGLDLDFAAAAASLVVEGPGLSAVPDRAAVVRRQADRGRRRAVRPSVATPIGEDRPGPAAET